MMATCHHFEICVQSICGCLSAVGQRAAAGAAHLESVDDGVDVRLDGLVGELGAGQGAHALQGQVAQVGLAVLQELTQLVARSHQQGGLAVGQQRKNTFRTFQDRVSAFCRHHE